MAEGLISLEESLAKYDRDADCESVRTAEQERQEVLKLFPLANWPMLSLERYALGQGNKQDCYCWWLEFGTPHVGSIKGGSARKHVIYKQSDGNWYYPMQFKTVDEAWKALRTSFVEAFTEAGDGAWDKVDQATGIALGPALSVKSLYCYFPNELLPISSLGHICHFLGLLGSNEANAGGYEVVRLNRVMLQLLRDRPEFEGWTTKELERFLYHWADPRDQRRAVKIAPGEDAKFWEECFAGGYIRVGWGRTGDLRTFDSKESFRAKFAEEYGPGYKNYQPTITKKANEVWTLRELEPGDLVIANKGTSRILAVGEVVEPTYEWTEHEGHDDDFNHLVHVKWDKSYAREIPQQKGWALVTVAPIPQTLLSQVMGKVEAIGGEAKGKDEGNASGNVVPVDPLFREIAGAVERKGQAILYGPPGTGKTSLAQIIARQTKSKFERLSGVESNVADMRRVLSGA
ncbi:MAG TPA: AAA family ATPase, partial [Tepidisphaeraceae bacterium]|nr:AAA family ATPase [Tepidisphaeraceae bacterium]